MQRAVMRLGGSGVGVGPGGGAQTGAERLLRALVEEGRMPLLTPLGRDPLTVQFAHGSLQELPHSLSRTQTRTLTRTLTRSLTLTLTLTRTRIRTVNLPLTLSLSPAGVLLRHGYL